MKVIFIIDSLQQGGAEQSLVHTIRHFPEEVDVTVVYLYPKENLLQQLEETGCSIIGLNIKGSWKWLQGVKKLKQIIKNYKPDLLVSCLYDSNIISRIVSKQTGVPIVGTLVSDSYGAVRISSFGLKRKVGFYFYYLIDRFTSFIPVAWIANSKSIKETNAKKLSIPLHKIEVIYRGRDSEKIPEWQSPENSHTFRYAFVGRLLETKGLGELIDAFKAVETQFPQSSLDIYGDGPYREKLQTLIQKKDLMGKVILHGNVNEAWRQLYHANTFVFPSWYEGFSGALVEAMMVGLPIIASDIPMNLEAVEHGVSACVYKVKNVSELTERMKQVQQDYHGSMMFGKNARRIALERFEIKQVSKQYTKALSRYKRKDI
jgi:glycosyltransferase involved in cell wall biosynthesis